MTDPWLIAIWSPWIVLPLLTALLNWLFPERPRTVGEGWVAVRRDLMKE